MSKNPKIIKTTYGEKDAQLIDELLSCDSKIDFQKITLSIDNQKEVRHFEIEKDDILQLGSVMGFKTLIIRSYDKKIPKEAEKFFATSKKGDLMAMEVIGKKDNITYYFFFDISATAIHKGNILAHFNDTLILY